MESTMQRTAFHKNSAGSRIRNPAPDRPERNADVSFSRPWDDPPESPMKRGRTKHNFFQHDRAAFLSVRPNIADMK